MQGGRRCPPAPDGYHRAVPSPSSRVRRGATVLLWLSLSGFVLPACGGGGDAVTDAAAPSSATAPVRGQVADGDADPRTDSSGVTESPASATTSTTRSPAVAGGPSTTARASGRPAISAPKPPVRPSTTAPRSTTTVGAPVGSTTTTTRPPRTTTLPPRPDAFCELLAGSALADLARLGGFDVAAVDELLGQLSTLRGSAPTIAVPWIDSVTPVIEGLRVEVEAGRVTDSATFLIWAAQLAADDPTTVDAFRKGLFNLNAFYRKRCLV